MKINTKVAKNYFVNYELLKFDLAELLINEVQFLEEDTIFSVEFYEYRVLVELTFVKSIKHLKILSVVPTY